MNMQTPKIYQENLKNNIITDEMVSDVLYSYSKRAKNYRDKKREYLAEERQRLRYGYGGFMDYDNSGQAEINMNLMYRRKDNILKHFQSHITCIHKQDKHARERIYDYDKRYYDIDPDDVVWENCYYDRKKDREVWFVDIEADEKEYLYFVYYEFPGHSFHNPIDEGEIEKNDIYKSLDVIELDELVTYGENVNDLLSLQFCDKVYEAIMGKDFNRTMDEINNVIRGYYESKYCTSELDTETGIARYLSRYSGVKVRRKDIVDIEKHCFTVTVQSQEDKSRLVKIGVPEENVLFDKL